ncbi:MAG TPA: DUF4157 domain-containing protein [Candidatus Tectomicrobia bacterium]
MPSFTPVQTGLLQRKCACGGTPGLTGECEECRRRRLTMQRSAANQAEPSAIPPIVHEVLRSPGQPLDPATRTFMESRFGHDFSRVRVHTDSKAADSARAVNALAYTVGRDVVLGTTAPTPRTAAGRWLLAHELAHVVQQLGHDQIPLQAVSMSSQNDGAEAEADTAAERIVGGSVPETALSSANSPVLSRLPFGIRLPTGLRFLDPTEETMARAVYSSSLIFWRILLSDALGGGSRPFTTYVPSPLPGLSGVTVINIGPSAYTTPGSNPDLLIHELAHSWQSQHHPDPTQFMGNSLASQAAAAVAGGSAYCYVPGKWFGLYGAEQIAQQVENGEAPIVSHVAATSPGVPDVGNIASLSLPHWETPGTPGVRC